MTPGFYFGYGRFPSQSSLPPALLGTWLFGLSLGIAEARGAPIKQFKTGVIA